MEIIPRLHLKKSTGLVIILIVAIAITGFFLLRRACPWGIGVGYDSYMYITSAESIAKGLGASFRIGNSLRPLVHFPPLYPFAISILIKIGLERISAVTLLSCFIFSLNILTAGFLVFHFTRRSIPGIVIASLVAISPVLLEAHLLAMSEPLFYFFMLLTLGILTEFYINGRRSILTLSAITAALAMLTRFIGVVFMPVGFISIWMKIGSIKRKMTDSIIFFLIGFGPITLWAIRNITLKGSISNRHLVFHPPQQVTWESGKNTLMNWILPAPGFTPVFISWLLFTLAIICILIALWSFLKAQTFHFDKNQTKSAQNFITILVIFCCLYVIILLSSLTFFDASTKLNDRILSPLYLALLLIPGLIAAKLKKSQQLLLFSILLIWVGFTLPKTQSLLTEMRTEGLGFNSRSWLLSPAVDFVKKIEPNIVIYSNEALPLEFLTGISIQPVPEVVNSLTNEKEKNITAIVEAFKKEMMKPDRILIIFPRSYRPELPPKRELIDGLVMVMKFSDARVYIYPDNVKTISLPK